MSGPAITRAAIVQAARGWIGTPYRHQASLRGIGTDCLGLVRGVWREVLGPEPQDLPPYQPGWAEEGGGEAMTQAARRHMREIPLTDYRPGDVLLFRWRAHLPAKHAGLVSGESSMIHAQEGAVVAEIALQEWWRRHIASGFRFPGVAD